jgi:acyl-CoA reductase-like NAD-dependent aldehyde dehydrogenase
VSEVASATIKRVTLELGGKSANLILADGDLERAVSAGINQCYMNAGQTCTAWTRMLVPRALESRAIELAKAKAESMKLGNPLAEDTRVGPLITSVQRERVRKYIASGLEQGARLVTGGAEQPAELPKGYYVRPTVFGGVTSAMTIAQEEIFGPVLSVLAYDSEDDGVRIANDTIYGLSGAVWSADAARAKAVARRLRTGQVSINGGRGGGGAPFGGFKQSGLGREGGKHGLAEFFELKSMQL